jgi:hypothetical protein
LINRRLKRSISYPVQPNPFEITGSILAAGTIIAAKSLDYGHKSLASSFGTFAMRIICFA